MKAKEEAKRKIIENNAYDIVLGTKCKHYSNVDEGFYCWKCLEKLVRFVKDE